ncbi:MAG: hypothetical protein HRU80_13400 [Ignavibacteriales bacterium]|nr:MAG: hypothetical protein HRU80_13400 [Ignavibacteriales bacterium]
MFDSRDEIPQWTWYNGQFLFQFDEQLRKNPSQTVFEFYNNFLSSQELLNLNIYHTKNQGTVILLLYGLLVVPKEIWEKSYTSFNFTTRNKFHINTSPNDNITTLDFLRLLRNSLAHANFSIDVEHAKLKFWNIKNGLVNFEVEISYGDLGEFIAEIGKYYINDVKNVKE